MRRIVLASMLFALMPWLAMAQSTDDLYFIPKKEKKTEASQKVGVVPKEVSNKTVNELPSNTAIVVKDVKGNVRDVDEYNRRYTSRDNTFSYENDTLYIEEKPYGERGEWVNGFQGSDMDYEYAMRLVRFRNPRYAIPISSPLYWDVVYGAFPSWDWNVYDDGMYAYIFPTYTNRLWWDWRWSYGFYGPGWGWYSSWYSPWYSPWYYGGWYSPWYAGYWGGYWGGFWGGYYGPGWHHHYPYYGWNSGWYRSGHTDYRAGRYQSYNRGNSISGTGTSYTRRTQSSSAIATNRANTAAKRSSIGRVVTGSSTRGDATQSVRPGRTAIRNQGVTTGTGTGTRVNSGNTYTRPSTGTYTRRSTTNVDRTGSNYNRPSSTRRSSNYYNNSNTRSTYQRSNTGTSGSSFNRGSSSYSRSSGGSVTRSSGGSSRRR
ncbi:hypothetical protein H6A30_00130 [Bacteroides caecigallinarum]|uniref:hypothetical protein n=1 Tax=Bacteroides caecigallinarum TaxID=1411144 RepID=UPI00195C0EF8|nr:hypothetical protein [Bacteroides caecigallinarum]MBM6888717.1 hypothetical protein [Bacteroides caecigallinarum]